MSSLLVRHFDLAPVGQTSAATDGLQRIIKYLYFTDAPSAQQVLAAGQENPFGLHPATGIAPAPIKAAAVQARAAAEFLASEYSGGLRLVLGVMALPDQIQWDNARTEDAASPRGLGRHSASQALGLNGYRFGAGHSGWRPDDGRPLLDCKTRGNPDAK
jgi:hypothetical protein